MVGWAWHEIHEPGNQTCSKALAVPAQVELTMGLYHLLGTVLLSQCHVTALWATLKCGEHSALGLSLVQTLMESLGFNPKEFGFQGARSGKQRFTRLISPKRSRSRSQEVRSSGCGTAKTLEVTLGWEPEGPGISTALPTV